MTSPKIKIKTNGETITEVLVATTILVSILTVAFALLVRGTAANTNITNRVIAINIAREGVEAVRNIRDTNWLKYSGNRRSKWLCLDSSTPPLDCTSLNPSDPKPYTIDALTNALNYYTVDFNNTDKRYYLTLQPDTIAKLDISPSAPSAGYELFELFQDATTHRYTHDDNSGANNQTSFYRQITLEYPPPPVSCNIGDSHCCNSATHNYCGEKKLVVISEVQWLEEGKVHSISLETHLFDFYERDEY